MLRVLMLRRVRLVTRAKIGRNSRLRQPRAEKSGQVLMAFLFERGAKIGIAVLLSAKSINHMLHGVDNIFAATFSFEGDEKELHFVAAELELVFRVFWSERDDRFFDGLRTLHVIIRKNGADICVLCRTL